MESSGPYFAPGLHILHVVLWSAKKDPGLEWELMAVFWGFDRYESNISSEACLDTVVVLRYPLHLSSIILSKAAITLDQPLLSILN